jgi:hypothetical protein
MTGWASTVPHLKRLFLGVTIARGAVQYPAVLTPFPAPPPMV